MLPIAAVILTDDADHQFDGVDLGERAALGAARAGIPNIYFTGRRQPDLAGLRRLRAHGVFGGGLLGWPRLFAGLPSVERLVVLDARTVIEPAGLVAVLRAAAAAPQRAALAVDLGSDRKNSLISVNEGNVTSVMGDGNATWLGIVVIPGELLSRIAGVRSMQDAIHRLAKAGHLRAVTVSDHFCAQLGSRADVRRIERAYRRHTLKAAALDLSGRLARVRAAAREWLVGAACLSQEAT